LDEPTVALGASLWKSLIVWFWIVYLLWDLLLPAAIPDYIRDHPAFLLSGEYLDRTHVIRVLIGREHRGSRSVVYFLDWRLGSKGYLL
jgi:hypothetical protein